MLPPIIPLSAVPVTSQTDPVKVTPEIPAVVPTQATADDATIDLRQERDRQEHADLLRDRQQRREGEHQAGDLYSGLSDDELNADHTVPVSPLGERTRQGLLVDIKV